MDFSVDKSARKIKVKREFAAARDRVWSAWTDASLLDQWWAPKPWKAVTKVMDFREGGYWLYAMTGPDGEKHWARADFLSIRPQESFSYKDAFCDENGTINQSLPQAEWMNRFSENGNSTVVEIEISYENLSDLESIIEMGFKEGFSSGLENLDELLEK